MPPLARPAVSKRPLSRLRDEAAAYALRSASPYMTVPAGRHAPRLTARQAEVVGLVARGFTNEQIGGLLGISERGVRAQISRLLKRFGV
ncbi:MAG: helix-turn-helix transcriptional regulator, partial [Chloroflexi bacterium]|nr:helix-turn-helix transcriptional regulator [Chloroflexota bacterium]